MTREKVQRQVAVQWNLEKLDVAHCRKYIQVDFLDAPSAAEHGVELPNSWSTNGMWIHIFLNPRNVVKYIVDIFELATNKEQSCLKPWQVG